MAALMGRYKHGVKSTRFSGRLTPSGRGEIAGRDAWQHGLDTQLVQDPAELRGPLSATFASRNWDRESRSIKPAAPKLHTAAALVAKGFRNQTPMLAPARSRADSPASLSGVGNKTSVRSE